MNNTGWIKLHRSIKDNPKLLKGINFALWCYILISVVHNEENVLLAGNVVTLQPGQGVFSTPDLANKFGFSVSGIRRALNWLENEHQIEQQKTTKGTVITVVNWDKYQQAEQQDEHQLNNNRTTTEQQLNNLPYYKKNDKNEKNDKNNINNTNVLFVDPSDDEPTERVGKFGKFQPIVDAWNSLPVQSIVSLKSTRLKLLEARIKEHGFDEVIHGITMIRNSKFLLGQNNNGWQITFDWFIKPNNFVKVLEGNYDDNKQGARVVPQGKNDTLAGYQRMMELLGSDEDNEQS